MLDTNVYVSAFHFPGGRLAAVWRHARKGTYEVVVSTAIIRELARILRHSFEWDDEEIVAQLKIVARVATVVTPTTTLRVIADDPDGDQILACAVARNAQLIVSGDKDLLQLKEYKGIGIMRPMDFLRTIGEMRSEIARGKN
ncbi:MAG: putative toxin-antitoxin system toxin component, PIN family [Methylococcales bacterium]